MSTTNEKTTLVCLFHTAQYAEAAVQDLLEAGIDRSEIFVIGGPKHLGTASEGSEIGHDLGRFHLPKSDVDMLTDGLDNGGTLVAVEPSENAAGIVESIFQKHQATQVDEKTVGGSVVAPLVTPVAGQSNQNFASGETVIPVVEEELVMGKRQVETGRARVVTRVVEKPVQETITLREETATIERRPVNREVTDADVNAFRDQSIQVTEMREEPVVSKTARVVEEVVVGKEMSEHTERVKDSVRKMEVEVEDFDSRSTR